MDAKNSAMVQLAAELTISSLICSTPCGSPESGPSDGFGSLRRIWTSGGPPQLLLLPSRQEATTASVHLRGGIHRRSHRTGVGG